MSPNATNAPAPAAPPVAASPAPDPNRWWVLIVAQASNLLSAVDATSVNVALPIIARETATELSVVHWVTAAYLVATTVFLPLAGRAADAFGHSRIFTLGFVVFTLGSLGCWLAPTVPLLIAARTLQAIGAASLLGNANALLTLHFTGGERGFVLGLNSTIVAAGYALGYAFGGLLTHQLGWRSIFIVNTALGVLAIFLCLRVLKRGWTAPEGSDAGGLTPGSSFLWILGTAGPLVALDRIGSARGVDALSGLLFASGVTGSLLFWRAQRGLRTPILNPALFRISAFSRGTACLLLFVMVFAAASFILPFFLQGVKGLDPAAAGLALAPYSIFMCLAAPLTGWLSTRSGANGLTASGCVVGACVAFAYASFGPQSTVPSVAVGQGFLGLAGALFLAPNRVAALASVPDAIVGQANGILQATRFFGLSVGMATASVVMENLLREHGGIRSLTADNAPAIAAFLNAQTLLFAVLGAFLLSGAWVCARRT